MTIRKKLYKATPWFFMVGAILTIGLLSFGGALAAGTSLPVALTVFVLAVVYEGIVYFENIKHTFKKLFKPGYFEQQLAKECLKRYKDDYQDCPAIFKNYNEKRKLLHLFEGKNLDAASRDRKQHLEKILGDMEKWFAVQLFSSKPATTKNQKELREWLAKSRTDNKNQGSSIILTEAYKVKRDSQYVTHQILTVFSLTAGVFMGLGSTYLLVDAFTVIPWLAALPLAAMPILIVPMAMLAGVAHAALVYNATTDMFTIEKVNRWHKKFTKDYNTPQKILMGLVLSVMVALTIAVSICTFGTWVTVVKTTRPLFGWMRNMPSLIMRVLNPLISSISMAIFNMENITQTLENADKGVDDIIAWVSNLPLFIMKTPERLFSMASEWIFNITPNDTKISITQENWLQRLLNNMFVPLRRLLYLGHIISNGLSSAQIEGINTVVAATPGMILDGVVDWPYLDLSDNKPHEHTDDEESGHNHENDLPSMVLTRVFAFLYVVAGLMNKKTGNEPGFWKAVDQRMRKDEVTVTFKDACDKSDCGPNCSQQASPFKDLFVPGKKKPARQKFDSAWQFEQAIYRIERYKEKNFQGAWSGSEIARKQILKLNELQDELRNHHLFDSNYDCTQIIHRLIDQHLEKLDIIAVYRQHGFFSDTSDTSEYLKKIPSRLILA